MTKMERMEELVTFLDKACKAYYVDGDEIINNFTYDKLYDELMALEKELNIILPKSPTVSVGYEILSDFPKETHETPMLSLDKTKLREELKDFIKERIGFLSWKLDGLTVVLTYKNGELVKAVTRGNGKVGEVITPNAKFFKGVPSKIDVNGTLVVRGEAIISYSDFERINAERKEGTEAYKNPRNLAAGTVRQLNTRITARRNVQFKPFQLVSFDETTEDKMLEWDRNSYSDGLEFLRTLGFEPVDGVLVKADEIDSVVNDFSEKIKTNDFPSDGLVLVFDDVAYGLSLGTTAKFPRYGIAFKWKDETSETILRDIEWSPSRTGLLNPVAIFDTVDIEGTSVSRASVHNVSIIEELQLGVGDTIEVFKANMIIPQIATNLTKSGTFVPPNTCPCCGGVTNVITNFNTSTNKEIKTLYCTNDGCPAKHIGSFEQFVSRDAMNIVGLAVSTIERLIGQSVITTFADIYRISQHQENLLSEKESIFREMLKLHEVENPDLTGFENYSLVSYMAESKYRHIIHNYFEEHESDSNYNEKMEALTNRDTIISELLIVNWDGMGTRSYQKMIDAIEISRNVAIDKFLYALGIPNVGKSTASLICKALSYDINKIMNVTKDELIEIDGIGDVIADVFVEYFANQKNKDIVLDLLNEVSLTIPQINSSNIAGLTFVITGTLPTMGRNEAAALIEQNGGKVSGSVSKKTNYLLAGENAGSKLDKAKALGVTIISEDELKNMI